MPTPSKKLFLDFQREVIFAISEFPIRLHLFLFWELIFYLALELHAYIIPFLLSMEKHVGNYNNLFLFTKIVFTYYTVTKTCAELINIIYTNYA